MENRIQCNENQLFNNQPQRVEHSAPPSKKSTGEKIWSSLVVGLGSLACDEYGCSIYYWGYGYELFL